MFNSLNTTSYKGALNQFPNPKFGNQNLTNQRPNPNTNTHQHNKPYARPILGKYFKCNQLGHRSKDFPLIKIVHRVEGMEEQDEGYMDDDAEEFDNIEFTKGDAGEIFTGILQRILLTPREVTHPKRYIIFKIRCTTLKKVCDE